MIAYCPTLESPPALFDRGESGASEAASKVGEQLRQFIDHYSRPRLEILIPEILSLVRSSAEDCGDGIEAAPVSRETATQAVRFAVLLPKSLPIPELAVDPDGEISFDWIGKTGKMFSASIDGSGRIAYAGRFGEKSKVHGTEPLSDSCPQEILRGIEKATE